MSTKGGQGIGVQAPLFGLVEPLHVLLPLGLLGSLSPGSFNCVGILDLGEEVQGLFY